MSLSVGQAAQRLGVSGRQVRRLISTGQLRAERFGRDWVVDAGDLGQRVAKRPGQGRPFAPRVAWAALWHLSGLDVSWLSSGEMSRLRRRLQQIDAASLALATRSRAKLYECRVLPGYLEALTATDGMVRGGLSAADDVRADVVSVGTAEVYCSPSTRLAVFDRYGVQESTTTPNVYLRVPAFDVAPILTGREAMPAAVVAVDLLVSADTRTARAGRELAERLLVGVRR